ncbi:MAG: AfsR/SARP family transcriptional regulator, partial [Vicinamibacterales bacterium]
TLQIWLLGGFRVVVDGREVDRAAWRVRKATTLVKLLALTPGHVLHREELMDRLWPDLPPGAAANNLRYAVHAARRAMQPAADRRLTLLSAQGERIVLSPVCPVWTDLEAFESAAIGARGAADPAAYDTAIDLYGGELLPDDRYEDWAAGRREALSATYLGLLVDVARLREGRGEHGRAIAALERVVASDAAHEQAQVSLMRLRALVGQRGQALRHYKHFERVLRQELDTEPDAASQRLYQDILAGLFPAPEERPVAAANQPSVATLPRTNLPVPVTSFIGREREMAEIQYLLRDSSDDRPRTRLLTLAGAGGSGKTRLALALAADLVPAYADGV